MMSTKNQKYSLRSVLFPDRKFWQFVFLITLPIAIQNVSVSLLSLLDVSIMKVLGDEAVGAVSLAGQLYFIANNVTFGITSGASIYLSRFFGEKNHSKIKSTFVNTFLLSGTVNALTALIAVFIPGVFMKIVTDKAVLIELGCRYLRIMGPAYLVMGINICFTAFFRSAQKAQYVLLPCFISIGCKTALNFILVRGVHGIGGIGIEGAAWATLISQIIEFSIDFILYLILFRDEMRLKITDFRQATLKNAAHLLKLIYPVILNESFWAIGIALFSVVFGRMSVAEISALNIAKTVEELFNSFFYGIGIGAVVVIGRSIGAKEYEKAKLDALRYLLLGAQVGILILIFMTACNGTIVDLLFSGLSDRTILIAKVLIMEIALFMPFRSTASVINMGLLRAGGRSKFAMFIDVLPIYLYSLPIGVVLGLILKLPIIVVLPFMYAERVIKTGIGIVPTLKGKWYTADMMPSKDL